MRNLAERHHDLDPVKQCKLAFQEWPARADLFRARLVVRRSAVAGRGDVRIVQREPILNAAADGWVANPVLWSTRYSHVPTASPVNIRPVRFAP